MITEIEQMVYDQVQKDWLAALTPEARQRVQDSLDAWLLSVRKKPLPDLEARIAGFRKRIEVLAATFQLAVQDGQFVVKASGQSDLTLRQIARGSDWFDPAGDVTAMVIGAVFE